MEKYYGNYLGLTINNDDPEKRGRVQVFVPHIMPALYDGWNKNGNDINITCVGDNLPDSLTSEQIEKLRAILPWAEAASPIMGSSSPGNLVTQAVNKVTGAVSGAINAVSHYLFDQSPVAQPTSATPQDQTALFNAASQYGGISPNQYNSNSGSSKCGIGSRGILGALTGDPYFANGLGGNAASLASGNNYLTNSPYFKNGGQPANLNDFKDPSKIPIGTTVAATGGGSGDGHVQVWTGSAWVSDFTQSPDGGHAIPGTNGILGSSHNEPYSNFTVYYPTTPIGGGTASSQQSTTVPDYTSGAGETAIGNAHATQTPTAANDSSQTLNGSAADPTVSNLTTTSSDIIPGSGQITPKLTAYSPAQPGSSQYKMEGGTESSKVGPDGTNVVRTLQDVASGKSSYVTIAGDPSTYGQTYNIPNVTFTNAAGQTQTLTNVTAVVHDTGSAFAGAGLSHFDVAVDQGLTNSQMANQPFTSAGLSLIPSNPLSQAAITSAGVSTSLVHNTSPHGAVATQPLNNTAKGVFTYPAAGSMLWVFFREGNPLYPVYFAASYSVDEWKSATRHGSNGPMMTPGATEDGVTSTGGIMNLNGVGGLRWEDTNHPTDPTKSQKSMMFFGEDGSNMFMGNGYHQIFSKFDRRDQVEGDRWNTTLGHKEDWVQGDHNHVTMGNTYVKIGNVSQPAVDAVTRIQQLIKEGHKPLTDLK